MMSPDRPGEHDEGLIDSILQRDEQTFFAPGRSSELLTFLVADIRGYTRFTQQRGDEAAAKLTARFANVVRDLVPHFNGTVFELRGDEALCVFGSPRQCLRLAVALQQRFVDETATDPDVPLGVGIGIDTGEAVPSEDGFRGGALNLAARLCGHARAGDVLVTPEVTHLAGRIDGITYDILDQVVLKGMTERVRPVRVVPDGGDPAREIAALLAAASAPTPPRLLSWLPRPLAARPRAILAAALVVLAAIGTIVGFMATGGREPTRTILPESSVGILDPATGEVLDHIYVAGGPTALAAGFGSMWTADTDANTVTRIDMADHRVLQTVDVGAAPSAIAVGAGSVWVVNTTAGTLSRIDPDTNQPQTIQVGTAPRGVVVAHGSVWVTNSGDGTVSRIDPDQNLDVQRVSVGFGPNGIAAGRDIWVANSASNSVTKIDATTHTAWPSVTVGTSPEGISVLGDQVWVTNNLGGTVTRIPIHGTSDPRTSDAVEEPRQFAAVDGHIWLAGQATGTITQLSPASGEVGETVPIGPIPGGLAAARNELWVTTTIDPARHRGGTLRLVGGDFVSVDPNYAANYVPDPMDADAQWLFSNSYDGLVAYAHTTGADSTAIVPDLATKIPAPSPDGRSYTFTLRSGIRWSTGQPVTVSDVKRGIERALVSGWISRPHQIVGSQNCSASHCDVPGIAIDDHTRTVTITLKAPNGNFIDELVGIFAVPAATPLAQDDTTPIPATGPYQIGEHIAGKLLVLNRNPYFHEWSAAAQPAGFPDTITWRVDPDFDKGYNRPGVNDVAAGRADWVDASYAGKQEVLEARFGDRAHATPSQSIFGLFLNTRIPPFNKVQARRALAFALDRYEITRHWNQPATIACQLLPPGYSAYRPYCPYTRATPDRGEWRAPDEPVARQLFRQSHTRGMSVTVVDWNPAMRASFNFIVDALNDLGYHAKLRVYGVRPDYFDYVSDPRHKVQAAFFGWIGGDATAASLLDIWRCREYKPAAPNRNPSGFCNRRYDRLLIRARELESTSLANATHLWAQAERVLVDKASWIPLVNPLWIDLVSTRVHNNARSQVLGMLFDQMRLR